MKKTIMIVVLVFVFWGGALLLYRNRPTSTPAQISTTLPATSSKWETKTDEQVNVTVVVTPIDFSPQSSEWKFDVGMNTHVVELDQDMTKIVVLIDDKGKEYKPIGWEGPVGGHHREGVLTFKSVNPMPKSVELKITGIGGVIRTFVWQL